MRAAVIVCMLAVSFAAPLASSVPPGDDVVARARAELAAQGTAVGVELRLDRVVEGLAHTVVRFQASHEGVPVAPARADVVFDAALRVVLVNDGLAARSFAGRDCPLGGPEAEAVARRLLPSAAPAPWGTPPPRRVWYDAPLAVPAWEIVAAGSEPFAQLRVFVACTGEVLATHDELYEHEVEATGVVFPENPIVAAKDPELRDNPVGAGLGIDELAMNVELLGLEEDENGLIRLAGPYVAIAEQAGLALATADDASFEYSRADPRFEEVMIYYYVDWGQRHIQELGFHNVRNGTIVAMPRVPGAYTAFYSGSSGPGGLAEIWFGWHAPLSVQAYTPDSIQRTAVPASPGLADAAEDANVIFHEYGHAVLDEQSGICCTDDAGALHEAYGDWQAASFLTRFSDGFGDGCMAEWFGSYSNRTEAGDLPCYRDLNNDFKRSDFDSADDSHFNGRIWSGALWQAEASIPADDFERVIIESNFLLPQEVTWEEAAKAILVAEHGLSHGTFASPIAEAMVYRGILTQEMVDETLASLPPSLEGDALVPTAGDGERATPGVPLAAVSGALAALAVARRRRPR